MFYRRQAAKHAQIFIPTAEKQQKVKKESVKNEEKNIEFYLREFRLDASVKNKLFDYGVGVLADIGDMEIEDINDLDLKPMEQKRFTKLLTHIKPLL